jgi:Tol biopolymer transport system component
VDGSEVDRAPNGQIIFLDDTEIGPPAKLTKAASDGSGATKLIEPGTSVAYFNPVFSPDGTRLAMTYYPRGFAHKLAPVDGTVVLDAATGEVVANIAGAFDPAWTPDGRLVMAGTVEVPSGDENGKDRVTPTKAGLFISSADLKTATPIAAAGLGEAEQPSVSPDGTLVAFMQADHIYVVGIDGTGLRPLTAGGTFLDAYPTFSPDGTSIAFQSLGTYGASKPYAAVAILSADLEEPTTLTADADVYPLDAAQSESSSQGRIHAIHHMRWR